MRQRFAGSNFLPTALKETMAKHPSRDDLRVHLERLRHVWPTLRADLRAQLQPHAELKRRLQLVGAPTEPEEIGITRERLRASFLRAYHIRRRYTVLDVVVRTGLLGSLLDRIFGRGGIWEISSSPLPTRPLS